MAGVCVAVVGLSSWLLAQGPAPAPAAGAAGRLPVKRVILYKNGIGYFEHLGRVTGNQPVAIEFTSGQLNDVLKSLTALDLGGGRISGISYNSEAPLARRLGALRLPLKEDTNVTAFFEALRGAPLEVQTRAGGVVAGRLLSVERRPRPQGDKVFDVDTLVLVTDNGLVRSVELDPSMTVRITEAEVAQQVGGYLDLVGSARAQDLRRMVIATAGAGERPLFVSYVSEVPIWKTTYRIVLPSEAARKPFLQGWAIVDNTVGEDWTGVELSLVAGAPQSFVQQLSQPYYARRPVVPLPEGALLSPQTHEGVLRGGDGAIFGAGALAGRVMDATGRPLPGVTVSVTGPSGNTSEYTTDGDGHYRMAGLAPGEYAVSYQMAGFRSVDTSGLRIEAGERRNDVRLEVGAFGEAVMVEAPPAMLDTSTSQTGGRRRASFSARPAVPSPAPPPAPTVEEVFNARVDLEPMAQAQELGDLFEYKIKEPVTIRKNQSALVPILNTEIATEKVSLWNDARGSARPLRALWLTNSSTLTLDAGSFTVVEGDAFAGEGLVEALKPGERRLVSYATDLGVQVQAQRDGGPRRVTRVSIARGVMTQHSEERQRATYTVRNDDTSARSVVIEHAARSGWKLTGGTTPVETSAGAHRFRVAVEPKKTTVLTIDELHPIESRTMVSNLTDDQVTLILRGEALSEPARQALRTISEKKAELASIDRARSAHETEGSRIGDDQERLRENMKALKGSDEEKRLLQRYTRQLDEQETRLEVLQRESDELTARRDARQAELDKLIQDLAVDVALP
jgi:hypothetical protein